MNWSARPALVPAALVATAVPAFGADANVHGAAPAPWLPDELPESPSPMLEPTSAELMAQDESPREAPQNDDSGEAVAVRLLEELQSAATAEEEQRVAEQQAALEDARNQGFIDGEAAGREQERTRLAQAVTASEKALDRIREADAHLRGRLEDNLSALAVAIARQLMAQELRAEPGQVSALVRQALIEFPIDQQVSIRINPADLATITALSLAGEGASGIAAGREARWIADPAMLSGDCVVEGSERIVDGRVDTALERVYRQLAQVTQ